MKILKSKEARDEILYVHVTNTNKKFVQKHKEYGHNTLSSFVNMILDKVREAEENGKVKLSD